MLQFVRYTRFSSVFWLAYTIPATVVLSLAIAVDHEAPYSCDRYLRAWACAQCGLQVVCVICKLLTLLITLRLPFSPEPEEIEWELLYFLSEEGH